ncbi:Rne/Rng family ribonuclease [Rothia sp. CCM 9418]|uniref:Rne/Rng family ribonuclease n=1 Tax=Rothia sp. CCM 9418 TaxID=3402661 RepID=UPI003AE8CBAA
MSENIKNDVEVNETEADSSSQTVSEDNSLTLDLEETPVAEETSETETQTPKTEEEHTSELENSEAEDSSETEAEPEEKSQPKTQKEILAEELKNLTAAASTSNLLFFSPNLEEIAEKTRAEREARREALEAERRQRRLAEINLDDDEVTSRRRRRRRRGEQDIEIEGGTEGDPENTVTKVRTPRLSDSHTTNRVTGVRGSTRLEAKKIRRRESRHSGRRQRGITEAEFLARRESVERQMIVRQKDDRIQIGVLEDGVLAEHFVSKTQQDSLIGNVYLGKVQNVLPSMEAAFIDIGRGRNAVLYAGEVNWDVSGLEGTPRKIENALKSGDSILVQVTKDPVGHKGARLTSQVSLPGRFLVYVPGGSMTGISRKLPDTERARLKKILKDKLPEGAGVIVRTAAEGASEDELTHDINRLRAQWEDIKNLAEAPKTLAPEMLYQEPDLTIKTVRDVFNEDFSAMVVQGDSAWDSIEAYLTYMAPDLVDRLQRWDNEEDVFEHYRIEEQLHKALDRKVFLPSGGSLVIDRTEAMTVVDVNTGKFIGSGGNLEETVTKNNLEAAEEIVRQLRLRDIGGIIVIDFIDMVLESNRELVLRRLVECLGRDRTKHQVAEVTSLGLVQMTRKRMGTGLLEVFSEACEHCSGRGLLVHDQPLKGRSGGASDYIHRYERTDREDRRRARHQKSARIRESHVETPAEESNLEQEHREESRRAAVASIAAATHENDSSEESFEPKNHRKRKRRKASRRDADTKNTEPLEDSSELVLTIGGEVVELPHAHDHVEEQESSPEDSSFTLESLEQIFDSKEGQQPNSTDINESDNDEDVSSRFTQNSERLAAIQAGEARARAAQKAGRDVQRKEEQDSAQKDDAPVKRRRSRRASAPVSSAGASVAVSVSTGAKAQEVQEPRVTGVAQPGRQQSVEEGTAQEGKVSEQSAENMPAPRKKRRSRRAVSAGVGSAVTRQELSEGHAAKSVVASVTEVSTTSSHEEHTVMLGVGVSADQIKREGQ